MDDTENLNSQREIRRHQLLERIQGHPEFVIDLQSAPDNDKRTCFDCRLDIPRGGYRAVLWIRFPTAQYEGKPLMVSMML